MAKLFVAVDLPESATMELARIQPRPLVGLRLAATSQMHLTLHFIGEAEVERLASALELVTAPTFALTIEGVGQFASKDGAITLWAGIKENAELLRLHAAIALALVDAGHRPEARRYSPHITLARCGPEIPPSVVAEFLERHKGLLIQDLVISGFTLYSSTFDGDAPVYKSERAFSP